MLSAPNFNSNMLNLKIGSEGQAITHEAIPSLQPTVCYDPLKNITIN